MTARVIVGDALRELRGLPSGSARRCVTSPPYFGLRDYGVRGQMGLEKSPAEYLVAMVEVFREVRRVLMNDGTLWLNMGDSYATNGSRQANKSMRDEVSTHQAVRGSRGTVTGYRAVPKGFKYKDLMLMPARLAIMLQDDGWYVRSDTIWSKPNPMPESAVDRPTKSHEYVFIMSKSERYHYDGEAIAEPSITGDMRRPYGSLGARELDGRPSEQWHGGELRKPTAGKRPSGWADKHKHNGVPRGRYTPGDGGDKRITAERWKGEKRNARSVWTIPVQPFAGAHFATFPKELARRCILAGSARGDTVLDPFCGAGTTGLVANELGRNSVLIELNPEYARIARRRISEPKRG